MNFDKLLDVISCINIIKMVSNSVELEFYIEDFDFFISDDEIIFLINLNTEIHITISCIENIKYNEDNSLIIINTIDSQIIINIRGKDDK